MTDTIDIIDHLVGVTPDSKAEGLRARRPITREHAQKSWLALFEPADVSQVSLAERFAVATFVALLHGQTDIADFYAGKLASLDNGTTLLSTVKGLAELNGANGPYGHYPAGPLSSENKDGPALNITPADRDVLGEKLAAALYHAHLLVFRPREASPAALQALLSAGWSTTGIVTLSQLVSFLAFQIRVVAGLKTLAAA
ncbi:CMD domain protein [Neorhizobium sp. JUb45]|uniref:CMD domain protein n=1 Tax=unclassified Neorhizobium TaxID=2629175 RepID=UPI00104A2DF3|nr:CMD domain protein [Neorhizobium sp. JUb45]TCR02679.1 CMD domain protein [Neorhizobium sp. JUb45]